MRVSVCSALTFESLDLETSCLVCRIADAYNQNGQCSYINVIGSRSMSRSQKQKEWIVILPPLLWQAYGAVSLQLQWRQVHYSHSRYDATWCPTCSHA